jgi:hypothetical protein
MVGRHSTSSRSTRSGATGSGDLITPTTVPTTIFGIMDVSRPFGNQKLRTLRDIQDQVAQELAINIISRAVIVDGVRIAVSLTLPKKDPKDFLLQVASDIKQALLLQEYLFVVATTGPSPKSTGNTLILCGSEDTLVQRAAALVRSVSTRFSMTVLFSEQFVLEIYEQSAGNWGQRKDIFNDYS